MNYLLKECFNEKNKQITLGLDDSTLTYISSYNSTVVDLLNSANKKIERRVTCSPFCAGVIDKRLVHLNGLYAGGSSSGAVVALEQSNTPIAIVTDTGGSTIAPAARANFFGFKPSYGRISRYGLVPLCSILDTVSLMAKDKDTLKSYFKILDVYDPKDKHSMPSVFRQFNLKPSVKIASNLFTKSELEYLKKKYPQAIEAELLLNLEEISGAYWYVLCPDLFSNMHRFNGIHYKKEDAVLVPYFNLNNIKKLRSMAIPLEVKSRIFLGAFLLKKDLFNQNIFDNFKKKYMQKLGQSLWITPVAKDLKNNNMKDTPYCVINNLLYRPSITIPSDLLEGFQISGPTNSDEFILNLID